WAEECIPKHWLDKDYLFTAILFNGIIHFWEDEDGKSRFNIEPPSILDEESKHIYKEKDREVYEALVNAYEWAKVRQTHHDSAETFQEEEALYDKDTKHLCSIIKYRGYMWM